MNTSKPEIGTPEPMQRKPDAAPLLSELFIAFVQLGATAFGGPAMVAYIRHLSVDKKGWLKARAFDDGVALCQAVPGATAMQTVAYVGLRARGVSGAAVSYVGFGLPAFGLMLLLAALYERTHHLPAVVSAFDGLQAIVVAIVANAAVAFGRTTLKQWRHGIIAALTAALFGWGFNPFLVVVSAALLGFWLLQEETLVAPTAASPCHMPHTTKPVMFILLSAVFLLAGLFYFHRQLYELATVMIRVDMFAFGGGFTSVPLLFNEVVTQREWLDGPTLAEGIVLGQVTPGPIVITATFIGYLLQGPVGAVVATLGVFLPSFLIVVTAAPHFDRLRTSPGFTRLTTGALCSFPGLLLVVTIHFARSVGWDLNQILLAAAAFVSLRLGINIFWVVLVCAGLSLTLLK